MNLNTSTHLRQPKVLYILCGVKMWEYFSLYGMRALLVLYLVNQMGVDDVRAFGIYAVYCSLFEFGGILGGRFADLYLGLRKSILLGSWIIAVGHLCLSIETHPWVFYGGLALIIVGSGLFSSNLSAFLGLFYDDDDPRRAAGYTLFYVGTNIGAFLASILCGIIGEIYGWHYGFGLAALGMIVGNILFLCSHKLFEGKGELTQRKDKTLGFVFLALAFPICFLLIYWENISIQMMPCISLLTIFYFARKMALSRSFSKEKLIKFGIYLAALTLFFAAEDQTASALLIFSERYATKTVAGFTFPVTALLSLNPFVIIVGGAFISRLKTKGTSAFFVIMGLLLASAVFAALMIACQLPNHDGLVPLGVVAMAILILSLGEVLLGPTLFSYFSENSPKEWLGATMGLLSLGFSLGNTLSGILSKSMVVNADNPIEALESYGQGFGLLSLLLALVALAIHLSLKKQKELIS